MSRIYLIRHPATEGGPVIKGNGDYPLLPGWEQGIDELADRLVSKATFGVVLASHLARSRRPAERLALRLKKTQIKDVGVLVSDLFGERDVGIYTGKRYDEIETGGLHPHSYIFEQEDIPNGEPRKEFQQRIAKAHKRYVVPFLDTGENLIVHGHGWWINEDRNHLLNRNLPYNMMPNLGMVVIEVDGKNIREIK